MTTETTGSRFRNLLDGLTRPLTAATTARVSVPRWQGVCVGQIHPVNDGLIALGARMAVADQEEDPDVVAHLGELASGIADPVCANPFDPEADASDALEHTYADTMQRREDALDAAIAELEHTKAILEDEVASTPSPTPRPRAPWLMILPIAGCLAAAFVPTVDLFVHDGTLFGWERWSMPLAFGIGLALTLAALPLAVVRQSPAGRGLQVLFGFNVALAFVLLAARCMGMTGDDGLARSLAVFVFDVIGIVAADRLAASHAAALLAWEANQRAGGPARERLRCNEVRIAARTAEREHLRAQLAAYRETVSERTRIAAQREALTAFVRTHIESGYRTRVRENHASLHGLDARGPRLEPRLVVVPGDV